MNRHEIGWPDITPEPFVALLLGARGEGKTALAHRLLEVFSDEDRDAYIMGFPEDKAHLLPEWIDVLPLGTSKEQWPEDSIVLIHEAHMLLHARRSLDAESLELDELVTVSRHKNSNIIYDTQQSQRLDKNAVAAVDAILVRWPALMQEQFERRAVRPIIGDARDALKDYVEVYDNDDFTYVDRLENDNGVDLLHKHVYVHADRFRGEFPHEVDLAEHWSEDISKAYGGHSDGGGDDGPKAKSLDDIRERMATPDELTERSVEDVEEAIAAATGEDIEEVTEEADEDDADTVVEDEAPSEDQRSETAREFIDRMIDSGNQVLPNDYSEASVEIIVPDEIADETEELIEEWDINPAGPNIFPQSPSFSEERPDIADDLTSFQFALKENDALGTSGYDIEEIIKGLEGEPFLATKSTLVEANLPA